MKGEKEGNILAFVRYTECVSPLDDVDKAVKCVCLQ